MKYNFEIRDNTEISLELGDIDLFSSIVNGLYSLQTNIMDIVGFKIDNKKIRYIYTTRRLYNSIINSSIENEILRLDKLNTKYNMLGYNSTIYFIYEEDNRFHIAVIGFANNMENYIDTIKIQDNIDILILTNLKGKNKPTEIVLPDNIILYIRSCDYEDILFKNIEHTKKIYNPSAGSIRVEKNLRFDRFCVEQYNLRKINNAENIEFTDNCLVKELSVKSNKFKCLTLNNKIKRLITSKDNSIVLCANDGCKTFKGKNICLVKIITPLNIKDFTIDIF